MFGPLAFHYLHAQTVSDRWTPPPTSSLLRGRYTVVCIIRPQSICECWFFWCLCRNSTARNLGSWFDQQLTMSTRISKLCGVAFYHLYNIKRIRKYLSRESTEMLVHAIITSRVDYCNSLLYRLPNYQLNKLQRVLNSSARLVCNALRVLPHLTPSSLSALASC